MRLSSGWTSYEVIHKDSERTPVSEALASGGASPAVIKKMLMVQEVGWPEAKRLQFGEEGKHRIVKKDDVIWLFKCPSGWRLYFYVFQAKKWIIYVHAICKKKNKEDPNDAIKARAVYDDISRRASAITSFPFPSD
jgi:hypothetical protein